ncbi:hypothetical protein AK812_SmicGene4704 [Symbiodinium microadriaticum]|uniref:Uncharacterized protein n=1 Tax=Symbiodinium microadriaticum TaxID=2951 RepID=A0A1Q9EVK9_SYMMI|nr:hypothetical protein AK812_SmicGene4704 [Symbiodinium microadriaticum]
MIFSPFLLPGLPRRDHRLLALARAQAAYSAHSILGSPEKDIDGASRATVAGAELDSSPYTRSLGLALVGPPRSKRVALAAITLEAARLTHTTDVLHLCLVGGWVSGFMYRRPFMSVFGRVFSLVEAASVVPEHPKMLPLPRRVADELVLAAALSHVLVSDISAPWASEVYATDSSDCKGAIVAAPVAPEEPAPQFAHRPSPKRPPPCRFHFLEIWGAPCPISPLLAALGWTVCPRLDPAVSLEYDLCSRRVFEWIAFLLERGRVDALGASLPLATFSPASKAWRFWHLAPDPAGGARDVVVREAAALLDLGLARRTASLALSALPTEGLESVFVNDLALSLPWEVRKAWTWPRPVHINILEASCVYRLVCALAKQSGPLRAVSLCDSNVAKCAITKGRSPSFGLSPVLRRLAAVSVAFGISCSLVFCPTRLMPADHPSRDSAIPEPVPSALPLSDKPGLLRALVGLPPLRRWASGWVRLVLGLGFSFSWAGGHRDAGRSFRTFVPSPLDFDRTLGFPGEGPTSPFASRFCSWVCLAWLLPACSGVSSSGSGFVASPPVSHGRLAPRNAGDQWRKSRRGSDDLPAGRLVEASTQKQRDALWNAFSKWLEDQGISAEALVQPPGSSDVDSVNCILTRYGRELYRAGRPYYSELINAYSSKVPKLRRLLQPAWDLAFSWKRAEPGRHHTAMPWQVLLGLVTTAFLWGWPRTAGLLALSWGGLLRIGEALAARRSDLMLPKDVWNTIDFAYLSIREPKTRYSAARHQSVRIDQPNVLRIVTAAFQALGPAEKLWPSSAQTLRTRFRQLCGALRLPWGSGSKTPGLELASLRAGGATWLLMADEDSELVRRRGRWLTSKIMEIYIQEVSSIQFLPSLNAETKRLVHAALEAHADVVHKVEFFTATGILPDMWYRLFSARTVAVDDTGVLGGAV